MTYISNGHHPPNQSYKLFTDGSKQDTGWTGAGWALTIGDQIIAEGSTMLGRWVTVYQAEMVAISEALRNILESDYLHKMKANGHGLEIYSDSQATIKTLAKVITPGQIAIECAQRLQQIHYQIDTKILWIKGHADHSGNELADMLVKRGACPVSGPEPFLPIPRTQVMDLVKLGLRQCWSKRWTREKYCRQTREMLPTLDKATNIKVWNKFTKSELRRAIGWITGHCPLNRHLTFMKVLMDKGCRLCQKAEETPGHLARECPGTHHTRHIHETLRDHPEEHHGRYEPSAKDKTIMDALYFTGTKIVKDLMAWQEPTVAVASDRR